MRKKPGDYFQITVSDWADGQEHVHQDLELLYVLDGRLHIRMGTDQSTLSAEDVFVANANKSYICEGEGKLLFARITINYLMICERLQLHNLIFWCDSTKDGNSRYEELRSDLKWILNSYICTRQGLNAFEDMARYYHLTGLLTSYFMVHSVGRTSSDDENSREDRIGIINDYVQANYWKRITLNDLSEVLYLSEGYLSRFFKKNYGVSFAEHLENIRIYHVVDDLLYTEDSITEIAYNNGFANMTAFNRAFRDRYGQTPSEMRKELRQRNQRPETVAEQQQLEERLEHYLKDSGVTDEKSRDIGDVCACSATSEERTVFSWKDTINIGTAADILRSDVREHMMLLRSALGFEYVRFNNIFSREMLFERSDVEEGRYNFTRLDSVMDYLIQQGLRPHIELGNKPKHMHRNVSEHVVINDYEAIDDEARLVDAVLQHFLYRYGREELDRWRMELWLEEWQWGQTGTFEAYYKRFSELYRIIRRYSQRLQFGGSGIKAMSPDAEISAFLDGWARQPVQPDYISVLLYAYESGVDPVQSIGMQSTDMEFMMHRVRRLRQLVNAVGMNGQPIYITEWNMSISDRNYMNDSCFKAAWIVKNTIDCYGMADLTAYFSGSDLSAEYYDSGQFLHGGVGLMNKEGILKPAGYAFDFLNRLEPIYLGKGSHELVTCNENDSYAILCHNMKRLSAYYYFTDEEDIKKESLWRCFEDRDARRERIRITDVENGTYKVKYYRVNEESGNALRIWENMGYENELSRNDIKYFRRACEPAMSISKVVVTDHTLALETDLKANEILLIRARKIFE